jgi:hypothetical protein
MYSNKTHRQGVRRETVMELQPKSYLVGWEKNSSISFIKTMKYSFCCLLSASLLGRPARSLVAIQTELSRNLPNHTRE